MGGLEDALDLRADLALLTLEDVLKDADIEAFRHQQLMYTSSLPLYQNSEELPEPPTPPTWIQELMED